MTRYRFGHIPDDVLERAAYRPRGHDPQADHPCRTCGGSGTITLPDSWGGAPVTVPCDDCNGTGVGS